MASVAVLLAIFQLDNVPDELQDDINATTAWQETKELLIATLKMNKSPIMWLLIQRNIWSAFYFALFYADWPRVSLLVKNRKLRESKLKALTTIIPPQPP